MGQRMRWDNCRFAAVPAYARTTVFQLSSIVANLSKSFTCSANVGCNLDMLV